MRVGAIHKQSRKCDTQTLSSRPPIPIQNHRALLFPDRTRTNLAQTLCHRSIPKLLNQKDSEALSRRPPGSEVIRPEDWRRDLSRLKLSPRQQLGSKTYLFSADSTQWHDPESRQISV
jgi:hypothetical protein